MDEPIERAMHRIEADLPRGAKLDFEVRPEGLHLKYLGVPHPRAGTGTGILAAILAEADARGIPVSLEADPSDEADTPSTFELVRWYARFGFEATAMDDDEWIVMERPATPPGPRGTADVLTRYEAARGHDLDQDGFRDILARIAPGIMGL